MRYVTLTCLNHPNLRWSCKEIAANPNGSYNGMRHIFFDGIFPKSEQFEYAPECPCPPSDLRFAPEEIERQKTEPLLTGY